MQMYIVMLAGAKRRKFTYGHNNNNNNNKQLDNKQSKHPTTITILTQTSHHAREQCSRLREQYTI